MTVMIHGLPRRARSGLLLAIVSVLFSACDPHKVYDPAGRHMSTTNGDVWTTTAREITVAARPLNLALGVTRMFPEFEIQNASGNAVLVERVELHASGSTYVGGWSQRNPLEVGPGSRRPLAVYWRFPSPVVDRLGLAPKIVFKLMADGEALEISVAYKLR